MLVYSLDLLFNALVSREELAAVTEVPGIGGGVGVGAWRGWGVERGREGETIPTVALSPAE